MALAALLGKNMVGMKAIKIVITDHQKVWAKAEETRLAISGGSLTVLSSEMPELPPCEPTFSMI